MNTSEKPLQSKASMFSSEALVGIGITIAELGLLALLLGWAQHMRSVPRSAFILLVIGAVLTIVGTLIAVSARSKRRPS